MATAQPRDIIGHVDDLSDAMKVAKTIDEIEESWLHFYLIESHIERTWPNDQQLNDTLHRLKSGLSQYSRDFREGLLSPYGGWRADLSSIRSQVSPQYDNEGWQK
ncbi:hypothetical protein EDF68_104128 [Ochrobactrum sp. BH3]|nr:hypothetical protein EDF68_104128 [Ochrobactrum sp. BH3]